MKRDLFAVIMAWIAIGVIGVALALCAIMAVGMTIEAFTP